MNYCTIEEAWGTENSLEYSKNSTKHKKRMKKKVQFEENEFSRNMKAIDQHYTDSPSRMEQVAPIEIDVDDMTHFMPLTEEERKPPKEESVASYDEDIVLQKIMMKLDNLLMKINELSLCSPSSSTGNNGNDTTKLIFAILIGIFFIFLFDTMMKNILKQ